MLGQRDSVGELSRYAAPVGAGDGNRLRRRSLRYRRDSAPRPLLTVEQVASLLGGISEAQVYRMAKGALRSAAVDVGEGTLRFDPERIERFVEARRRV